MLPIVRPQLEPCTLNLELTLASDDRLEQSGAASAMAIMEISMQTWQCLHAPVALTTWRLLQG